MSMMFFADEDEVPLPPKDVRITEATVQLAPDGHRVGLTITLTPFLEYPNLDIVLYRPDGAEERSVTIIGTMERHFMVTLHIKQPLPGQYRIKIDLVHENEILQTRDVVFDSPLTT